jgi:ribosomal-protein-alanine N-acetyltransferase
MQTYSSKRNVEAFMIEANSPADSNQEDTRPELRTSRLLLRPFQLSDAEAMEVQINDREIAANTRTIEYPYPPGSGTQWIEKHAELWLAGKSAIFAICDLESGNLMGAIGLEIDETNQRAELGYWLGRQFWNRGYCTEAAAAVLAFGLKKLALNKVHAHYLLRNPASGRVLEKIGMKKEGVLRRHIRKWGVFEDIGLFGMLARDLGDSVLGNL